MWRYVLSNIEIEKLLGLLGRMMGYVAVKDFAHSTDLSVEKEINQFVS